jgi:hypothetical protein
MKITPYKNNKFLLKKRIVNQIVKLLDVVSFDNRKNNYNLWFKSTIINVEAKFDYILLNYVVNTYLNEKKVEYTFVVEGKNGQFFGMENYKYVTISQLKKIFNSFSLLMLQKIKTILQNKKIQYEKTSYLK